MGYRCLCEGLWGVVLYGGEASRSLMLRCIIIIMYVGLELQFNWKILPGSGGEEFVLLGFSDSAHFVASCRYCRRCYCCL